VAWVLVSAALVIFMTLPGLALFYGGLVRSKNVLSVLMQVLVFSLVAVLWALYGYSFAFTEGNAFIGGGDRLFARRASGTASAHGATFSKGVVHPGDGVLRVPGHVRGITCALIVGAFAERIKFSAVLLFMCCGSPSATCRWRTWSGSGWARTPTPARKWWMP
jgi:Amt family ammonium transporter